LKYFILLVLLISLTDFISSQSWKEADQPEGGEIMSIDVNPLDTTKIVILVRKYLELGIWYSEDAGGNWRKIGDSYIKGNVKIDPVSNRIYASGFGMVIVTTDEGASWDTLYDTQVYIEGLDINPSDPSEIFFITPQGIFRSSDFGEDWTMYPHSYNPSSREFIWSPHDTNHVIIAEVSSMLKSSDQGVTWTEVSIPGVDFPLLFDPVQDSVLYRGEAGWDSTWFLKSTDYGTTWSWFTGFNYYHPALSFKENGTAAFLSYGSSGIFKSLDYGITWQSISQPMRSSLVHYNGINFYACFPSVGFAVYREANVWEFRNNGLKGHDFYSMTVTGSHTFLSTFNNTFRKANSAPAGEWESIRPDSILLDICFYNDSIGFGRDYSYRIFNTSDGGTSWHLFHNFFSIGKVEHIGIAGEWLFAAVTDYGSSDQGLYRVQIGQASWAMAIDGYNTRVLTDGSSVYGFDTYNPGSLQKSFYGTNWTNFAEVQPGYAYRSFSPEETPPGFLLTATTDFGGLDRGVLYFIDQSGNTTVLLSGLGIFGAVAPAGRDEYFFITTRRSIIYKADSMGSQPYHFDEGIPEVWEDQGGKNLFYFNVPGYKDKLYTNRMGLWVLDLNLVTESSEQQDNFDFTLHQNYPNPFNPSTTISYQIPERSFVSLEVFDMLGSLITELVNEEKSPGSYTTELNGTTLSSGVYFYTLKAGSFIQIKKMILMK
jgi:photosystem II stability/assembly factor-like uncharacterized protein